MPKINLLVDLNDVHRIVSVLEPMPYNQVAPLLSSIVTQTNEQLAAAAALEQAAVTRADDDDVQMPQAEVPVDEAAGD